MAQERGFWDKLKDFFSGAKETVFGKSGEFQQVPKFTPQQEEFLNNILGLLGGQQSGLTGTPFGQALSSLGGTNYQYQPVNIPNLPTYQPTYNPMAFRDIENQARSDFASKTVPLLSERFGALGGSGTARSSGLFGSLGAAGSALDRDLAAQRSKYEFAGQNLQTQQQALANQSALRNAALQLQAANQNAQGRFGEAQFGQNVRQQAIGNLFNAAGLGTGQRFDTTYFPGSQGLLQSGLENASKFLPLLLLA